MDVEKLLGHFVMLSFLMVWFGLIMDIWMDNSFWITMLAGDIAPMTIAPRIVFSGLVSVLFAFILLIFYKEEK